MRVCCPQCSTTFRWTRRSCPKCRLLNANHPLKLGVRVLASVLLVATAILVIHFYKHADHSGKGGSSSRAEEFPTPKPRSAPPPPRFGNLP